uniref:Uncharacterized protein n=1 Tax=Anguilla anguilla TaxID=7936 RepID=A0A0E9PCP0_ANGAN
MGDQLVCFSSVPRREQFLSVADGHIKRGFRFFLHYR